MSAIGFYGQAYESAPGAGTTLAIGPTSPRVQVVNPGGANVKAKLPDASLLQPGGAYFYILNIDALENVNIVDQSDNSLLILLPNQAAKCLSTAQTTNAWTIIEVAQL